MRTVRIFISSPGDVADERDRARQVIESLRRRYAGHFALKPLLWEDLPLQPDMSFQEGIDQVIGMEERVDIAVFILWSRLGSPVGAAIRKPDGSQYRSGTEREFDLMMAVRAQSGGVRPDILVYTRKDDSSFFERLRGKQTHETEKLVSQKLQVEKFIAGTFKDSDTGTNMGAYHTFDRPVTFTQRLRSHLMALLDRLSGDVQPDNVWDVESKGSPFMGLEAFQPSHAAVFFGREEQTLEARQALRDQARQGCAFLLLSGASGSGKSSLARAGILPAIVENEIDGLIAGWRTMVITPSELGPQLVHGLLQRLSAADVMPELRDAAHDLSEMVAGFRDAPELTFQLFLKPAFDEAADKAGGGVRLLIVLDQMEELFTAASIAKSERTAFFGLLDLLARSGLVWILATARADFYPLLQTEPVLVRMKSGKGQMDLLPPDADGLRRLVEEPARLAGLKFEERDGVSLASLILRDAVAHSELLPLVEYVLRELYEERSAEGMMTYAAYAALGGVEGALARRAEQVFLGLPLSAQEALPAVLQEMVTVGQGSADNAAKEDALVRQRAPMAAFASNAAASTLVGAFVKERLFKADSNPQTGEATVTVAHEALMTAWAHAANWAADNRELLQVRSRIAQRMLEGSPLLEGDPLLVSAEKHMLHGVRGFSAEQRQFVETYLHRVSMQKRDRARIRRQMVAGALTLVVIAIAAAVIAVTKTLEVDTVTDERDQAVTQREEAEKKAERLAKEATSLSSSLKIASSADSSGKVAEERSPIGHPSVRGLGQLLVDEAREATSNSKWSLAQSKLKEAMELLKRNPAKPQERDEAEADILVEQGRANELPADAESASMSALIKVRDMAKRWPDSWRLQLAMLRLEHNSQFSKQKTRGALVILAGRIRLIVPKSDYAFEALYSCYIMSSNAFRMGFRASPDDYEMMRAAAAELRSSIQKSRSLTETELEILVKLVSRDVSFALSEAAQKHYSDTTAIRRKVLEEYDKLFNSLEKTLPRSTVLIAAQTELGRLQEIGLKEGFHTLSYVDQKEAADKRQAMNRMLGNHMGVADAMAATLGIYSLNGATENLAHDLSATLASFRDLPLDQMTSVMQDYRVIDPLNRIAKSTETAGTKSLKAVQRQISDAYLEKFLGSDVDDRSRNLTAFAQIISGGLSDWAELENRVRLSDLWDKGLKDISLASQLDRDCESLMAALQACAVALIKDTRHDDAKKLADQAMTLGDAILAGKPWDWYLRNNYMSFCFVVAEAASEGKVAMDVQPMLRRAWSMSSEFWGVAADLDRYVPLPLKGAVPANALGADRALFDRYLPDGQKRTATGSMKRFTIPCTDTLGKEYPFFIYILSGRNGLKNYQDQIRWLQEYRGLKVNPEITRSFERLFAIAQDNNVDFAELCVYALGKKDTKEK